MNLKRIAAALSRLKRKAVPTGARLRLTWASLGFLDSRQLLCDWVALEMIAARAGGVVVVVLVVVVVVVEGGV
jgi:hypothetical protein